MTRSEFDRKYTSQLNPQQLAAVHAVGGAVLLLAVPGSGKTTVLVTRLGYMLCCCGISPDAILTMTYTKAATREMQKRFVRLFGQDCPQVPEIRTINGVSSKIIDFYARTHGSGSTFTVVENEGELAKIVSDLYRELSGEFATQSVIKELRKGIAYVKNMMLGKEDLGELDTGFDQFPELYAQYNLALRQRRWMDYDDQMIYAKTILENYPDILAHFQDAFPYICVDEAQDTSKIQHAIIQLLARKTGNLFMVGDEDQSIYGFRAAYPDALMQFEQTYPKARVLLMEENYRSTPEILHLANGFIRKNTDRRPKTVRPTRVSGANVHLISAADRTAQYAWLLDMAAHCDGQTAVLYRNNDSALPLIDLMERQGLLYRCRQMDDTFFTHRIVTDLLDIIAFANDRRNTEVFLRIYYKIGCGITKKAAEYACEACQRSGKTVLEELLTFSPLSQYARDSAAGLMDLLPQLLEETAARGLKRIWTELRYKDYVEQQQLDTNKFEILTLLAEREADLNTLVARLDYLRLLVAAPPDPSSEGLILSTVHYSKGLEYETVYLLDVLDGILPAVTEPKGPEEERRYQEERRLFYVAMTRAKDHLYLFSCLDRSSAFIRELRRELPVEKTEEDDLFAALREELCGKAYYHGQMAGGHKKVILLFAGTAWLWSCRFLFHQFVHRDKTHKVIRDADALSALPAALVRCFDVDALDKLPQGVGGHFLQILVFVYPLDELLQIFNLSFLYFDFLLQGLDFRFKLHLLVLIGLAHQRKPFIRELSGHIILIDTDEQPVKFPKTAFCLRQTLLVSPDSFFAGQPESMLHHCPEMRFMPGYIGDNRFHVHPDQFFQYNRPDEMG